MCILRTLNATLGEFLYSNSMRWDVNYSRLCNSTTFVPKSKLNALRILQHGFGLRPSIWVISRNIGLGPINHNEKLFRTTKLTIDILITFTFRAILTKLKLLGKNRSSKNACFRSFSKLLEASQKLPKQAFLALTILSSKL